MESLPFLIKSGHDQTNNIYQAGEWTGRRQMMSGSPVFQDLAPGALSSLRDRFITDLLWLEKNLGRLRKAYTGKYVAVKDRRIVGSGADMRRLVASLRRRRLDANNLVIEYIPAADCIWVL
jgi:hypothetical protein